MEKEKRKEGKRKIAFRGRESYKVCLYSHEICTIASQESVTLDTSSPHFSSGIVERAKRKRA